MDLLKHQDRTVDYLVNLMSHCFGLSLKLDDELDVPSDPV